MPTSSCLLCVQIIDILNDLRRINRLSMFSINTGMIICLLCADNRHSGWPATEQPAGHVQHQHRHVDHLPSLCADNRHSGWPATDQPTGHVQHQHRHDHSAFYVQIIDILETCDGSTGWLCSASTPAIWSSCLLYVQIIDILDDLRRIYRLSMFSINTGMIISLLCADNRHSGWPATEQPAGHVQHQHRHDHPAFYVCR